MFTYQLIEILTSRDVGRIIHLYTMPCYDIDEEHGVYTTYKEYYDCYVMSDLKKREEESLFLEEEEEDRRILWEDYQNEIFG
jgi:hypothetical protein